jgi:hypothetical protein
MANQFAFGVGQLPSFWVFQTGHGFLRLYRGSCRDAMLLHT